MRLEKLLKKFERQIEVDDNDLSTKYSVNIEKLAEVIQLPDSEEMVEIFSQQLNRNK